MPQAHPSDIDVKAPPFDRLQHIRRLGSDRSGRGVEHVRHHLYVGRDKERAADVLVKLTARPGLVYEQNLANEIAILSAINDRLPDSGYFPVLRDHGRLPDGRAYLSIPLFNEFPLATAIGAERVAARTVAYLRAALEVASALTELHGLDIFHVDLNPMNILYRVHHGRPVIRIVDFESSYAVWRHGAGVAYNPATTPGFTAPEVAHRPPDARADLFSLGAVLYTMLAGFAWTIAGDVSDAIAADHDLDPELKTILRTTVDSNPDGRYRSMQEFHAALAAHLESIWPGRSW